MGHEARRQAAAYDWALQRDRYLAIVARLIARAYHGDGAPGHRPIGQPGKRTMGP